MPNMGPVIASFYKIVVVHISKLQCLTFFPLRDAPPPITAHRILPIGYVNGCHFIRLELTPDAPLPLASRTWERYCSDVASSWATLYVDQMTLFKRFIGTDVAVVDILGDSN
ncbi:hypothetical protein QJS10_CPA07g00666 [Acorus calamus]|uniref:Uncharacterized protein n=1 Tax=Acorus calamus TaxID=4465 RepID=A0AAV9EDG6_ACOCL|nr:hypothetical protein QJS10_CPA07g00666 [Acorus calamus]